ncbi:hypothetical protein ACWEFD_17805 [Streptomyces ardesiacus]
MPQQPTPSKTPLELLTEAIARADALGWRTISLSRLRRLWAGDQSALPAPPKARP